MLVQSMWKIIRVACVGFVLVRQLKITCYNTDVTIRKT